MIGSQRVTTTDALSDDAQRRVDQLVEAVLALGSDLDLQAVLRRIVEVAVSLVDAQYGALGVMGHDGRDLSPFITVGIDEAGIAMLASAGIAAVLLPGASFTLDQAPPPVAALRQGC